GGAILAPISTALMVAASESLAGLSRFFVWWAHRVSSWKGIGSGQMSSERVYLTAEGRRALEAEVNELLTVRRPGVIDRIHGAQADHDADDSGSLEEAKDELAQIDGRAREIENMLRHAQILPESSNGNGDGTIHLGSHIVVRDQTGDEMNWLIVGSAEAN